MTSHDPSSTGSLNLSSPDLICRDRSLLFVIDMQEDTIGAASMAETVVANSLKLVDVALRLQIPTSITSFLNDEHGETLPELLALLPNVDERDQYSAANTLHQPQATQHLSTDSSDVPPQPSKFDFENIEQFILIGAHLSRSITQTALNLLSMGKQAFVVVDAVTTRKPELQDVVLQRLLASGVTLVTTDAVLSEWSSQMSDEHFNFVQQMLDG